MCRGADADRSAMHCMYVCGPELSPGCGELGEEMEGADEPEVTVWEWP